jgi:hypothetical protein
VLLEESLKRLKAHFIRYIFGNGLSHTLTHGRRDKSQHRGVNFFDGLRVAGGRSGTACRATTGVGEMTRCIAALRGLRQMDDNAGCPDGSVT